MGNRRSFIYSSSALIGGGLIVSAFDKKSMDSLVSKVAVSDQINLGAIGINGMGWTNVIAAIKVPGVNLVAICDVDQNVITKRMSELPKLGVDGSKVKTYNIIVIADKDIDVVIIGTSDHGMHSHDASM
jgi:hypothetical protein